MNRFNLHLLWLALFLPWILLLGSAATASDVYIRTDDNETGQGIFRQRGTECLVITPLHVVENGLSIQVTLADKRTMRAELIESFPGDIGVLRVADSGALTCRSTTASGNPRLDALLAVEKQGELRTMLADGSIRIVPVNITGYDRYRQIHVTPQDVASRFVKGASGSPLYIAGQFAGVLLAVTENVGNVLRSDALGQTVALFFQDDPVKRTVPKQSPANMPVPDGNATNKGTSTLDQELGGTIVQSGIAEHKIKLEGNSPVRLSFVPTGDKQQFNVEILDSARRIVLQNKSKQLNGSDPFNIPFTPPNSDTYSIYILGTKGEGRYTFKVTPITTNAQLRAASNIVHVGGAPVKGLLAQGAVAEYMIELEGNSPIRLQLAATEDSLRYRLDIVDTQNRSVYRDARRSFSATEPVSLAFTPPKNGSHLLRIIGVEGEGKYVLQAQPITFASQLRGEGNILVIGGETAEGVIALDAVAEYRLPLEAEQSVRFIFGASGDRGTYNIEIVGSSGVAAYINPSKRYSGMEPFTLPFTAPKKDTYTLRILGIEDACGYSVRVEKGARRP